MMFLELKYIVVSIIGIVAHFNKTDGNIGAMVGHTLNISQQIVEHKADLKLALASLQTLDMAQLHLIAEHIYKVF